MTMSVRVLSTSFLVALTFAAPVSEAAEPPAGSPERAAILAAFRSSVEADLAAPIGFRVSRIDVEGDWAYVSAIPTRGPDRLDWNTTKFADAIAKDMMSNMALGLLQRRDGNWRPIEYALGPTDAAWEEWISKHGVPRTLFVPADPATGEHDPDNAPIEGLAAADVGLICEPHPITRC